MSSILTEKDFEKIIVKDLITKNGYIQSYSKDYNKIYNMNEKMLFSFLEKTQKEELTKLQRVHKNKDLKKYLVEKIHKEIKKHGLLHVLRNGFLDNGVMVKLFYPKPPTTLNRTSLFNYDQNIFSVTRQLHYKDTKKNNSRNSVDLVIFLNGLPIITAELKNQFTDQNVNDGMKQYQLKRNPNDSLFRFNQGALVHFAVDTNLVYMTTKLQKTDTIFLPFNKGNKEGKGNPIVENDFVTSYLWKEVWRKDRLSYLISNFLLLEEDDKSKPKSQRNDKLIFPRYHQMDCVFRLLDDITEYGIGRRYLVQHSAGSGKSNTIAWTSHLLSNFFVDNKSVFDHIIIITDRVNLDKQLQDTIYQFEHKLGVIHRVEDGWADLAKALNDGARIIISTIQKFSYILDKVDSMANKKFAIIIDEAHSSQSGKYAANMKNVLSTTEEEHNPQDDINKAIESNINQNISYFAFTATPKRETIEIFSVGREKNEPFHLYSMKQAIEEGYILDVLQNYITYESFYKMAKTIEENPKLFKSSASRQISQFAKLHSQNISQKAIIIVEHFKNHVMHLLDYEAKAMVATDSREAAVRYKLEIDKYLKKKKITNVQTLVAFSGKVNLNEESYSEESMNGIKEQEVPDKFDTPEYKLLIVANKYQTGFDQPKLSAMYIDKKLQGINAVQTLSRLNRIFPKKKTTFIIDFVNKVEDIVESFQQYYKATYLKGDTDINLLYDYQRKLRDTQIYDDARLEEFSRLYKTTVDTQKDKDKKALNSYLDKLALTFDLLHTNEQKEFKSYADGFVRLYEFILQLAVEPEDILTKEYILLKYLVRKVSFGLEGGTIVNQSIEDKVDLVEMMFVKTGEYNSPLDVEKDTFLPTFDEVCDAILNKREKSSLSELVRVFNEQFDLKYEETKLNNFQGMVHYFTNDPELIEIAANNDVDEFHKLFQKQFMSKLSRNHREHKEIFQDIVKNEELKEYMLNVIIQEIYHKIHDDLKK